MLLWCLSPLPPLQELKETIFTDQPDKEKLISGCSAMGGSSGHEKAGVLRLREERRERFQQAK